MKAFTNSGTLGNYATFIEQELFADDGYIELERMGNKTFEARLFITSAADWEEAVEPTVSFIASQFSTNRLKPLWYKLNMDDNIGMDNVGIGFINLQGNWLKFVLTYLQEDLASEGGNSLIVFFDVAFKWAVKFEHFPYENELHVEHYVSLSG